MELSDVELKDQSAYREELERISIEESIKYFNF